MKTARMTALAGLAALLVTGSVLAQVNSPKHAALGDRPTAGVAAGALLSLRGITPVLFGDASFEALARRAGLSLPSIARGDPLPAGPVLVRVTRLAAADRRPGRRRDRRWPVGRAAAGR